MLPFTLLLTLADWGVWEWATTEDHGTIVLGSGLVMAALLVTFVLYAVRAVVFFVLALFQSDVIQAPPRTDQAHRQTSSIKHVEVPLSETDRLAA